MSILVKKTLNNLSIMTILVLSVVTYVMYKIVNKLTVTRVKDASSQYSLKDVVVSPAERQTLQREFREVFGRITVNDARAYLRNRGYSAPHAKADVNEACMRTRMLEIDTGHYADDKFSSILGDWHI